MDSSADVIVTHLLCNLLAACIPSSLNDRQHALHHQFVHKTRFERCSCSRSLSLWQYNTLSISPPSYAIAQEFQLALEEALSSLDRFHVDTDFGVCYCGTCLLDELLEVVYGNLEGR